MVGNPVIVWFLNLFLVQRQRYEALTAVDKSSRGIILHVRKNEQRDQMHTPAVVAENIVDLTRKSNAEVILSEVVLRSENVSNRRCSESC